MTPEDMLAAIIGHSQRLDYGKPDPLVLSVRDEKIGAKVCNNWRLLGPDLDGGLEISLADGSTFVTATREQRPDLYPNAATASGKQTRARKSHSVEEVAADALVGMYERNWHALQVAIGVGDSVRPLVAQRLVRIAYRLQKNERSWPMAIKRQPYPGGWRRAEDYVPDLVELVIRHLEQPFELRNQVDRAELFGLSEQHWHKVARSPFDQVAAHAWSWYYAGIGHIQHRIIMRRRRDS